MSGKELESKRKTAVVTDGKYRTSIAAVRALGRAGYRVVVTQTKADCGHEPPVFHSCFAAETVWLEGSAADRGYTDALFALLEKYDRPVLFCVGAVSLNAVSGERERFAQVCDFLIAPPQVLDDLNDKETVHSRCEELGIPVPCQYEGEPETYPVVIKPHCGEKFGLKAAERYAVANNLEEYQQHLERMRRYDPAPIVQQKIEGDGMGVSLLLGADGELINALCHRRIREYPAGGGPSTCCESFYDETMIEQAYRLLKSFGFSGVAMVEFKGNCVLEVNPRVWGSFPMTERAGSSLMCNYARAAAGEKPDYVPRDYQTGVRMRFTLNDAAATLDYLRRGQIGKAFGGMVDFFRVKEALSAADDPKPLRHYLRSSLLKR